MEDSSLDHRVQEVEEKASFIDYSRLILGDSLSSSQGDHIFYFLLWNQL
jgi:hypothetical protein